MTTKYKLLIPDKRNQKFVNNRESVKIEVQIEKCVFSSRLFYVGFRSNLQFRIITPVFC